MRKWIETLKTIGPGFAVAATGVGAGDLVTASVAGAKYGFAILWAGVFGAVIKFVLNEGISRWQLATGTTVLEGWITRFPSGITLSFAVYLLLWSIIVAAALASACGLAAHAMYDEIPVAGWAFIHSVVSVLLILFGRYRLFEFVMKMLIAMMAVTVLACAALVKPDLSLFLSSLFLPTVPEGSGKFLLGLMGGVGGSVTLMSYGYWIRERGWAGPEFKHLVQRDLGAAYFFTGLFAVAMIVIASGVQPSVVTGDEMALEVARRIESVAGIWGGRIFLLGFWGAVFTSMLGVWQGIPYLFADFVQTYQRRRMGSRPDPPDTHSNVYRSGLLFIAFPPLLLLFVEKPVWIIVIYSIIGAFFMPFLAGTLLIMNNRSGWIGAMKNGWMTNAILILSLMVFGYLCYEELVSVFAR